MRIGVIGSGALGLLCSSYLNESHLITLYVRRKEQLQALEENQLSLSVQGTFYRKTTNIAIKLIDELVEEDCLFITVKQTGIKQVMKRIQSLKFAMPLIFLQNGMGHITALHKIEMPTYLGIVQHGAIRESDAAVNHLGIGTIKLAPVTGTAEGAICLVEQLHTAAFPFDYEVDWEQVVKEKLIVNAVINPLTALFNVKNKVIIENRHIRKLAKSLCDEAAFVLGLDADKSWESVMRIAEMTGENTSSMRADILAGNITEIEAISGYLLQEHHENLPYTSFIYEAILGMEQKERS